MSGARIPYFPFYPIDFIRGIRGLKANEVGIYTMLLCRIYEENGPVEFHPARLSAYCGCREKEFASAVERLLELDRIKLTDGRLWDERAAREIEARNEAVKKKISAGKASAEKRQQNQQQQSTPVQHPFNHTDTDTEQQKEEEEGKPSSVKAPEIQPCLDHFNATAESVGWPKVQKLTPPRKAALLGRIRDVGSEAAWCEAMTRASNSPFLTGQTGGRWRADFDWLQKPANFTKLMEGNYDPRPDDIRQPANRSGRGGALDSMVAAFAQVAAGGRGPTQ